MHIGAPAARRGGSRATKEAAPPRESAATKARRLERERRARSQQRGARVRVVAIVAGVMLVLWACVGAYSSDLFAVKKVAVDGNERVTDARVVELAAVPAGATLVRFPAAAVEERVAADPWIASAKATRMFPDGMRITVTERVPAALVDDGKASFWLVAADGFVIAKRTAEDTSSLPSIRDVERLDVTPGKVTSSEALLNALRVAEGLSDELMARVRLISAPTVEKTAVYTTDGIEIFFGDSEDLAEKDEIARRILAEQAGKVVYINVRSVQRPTWRGLGDAP